MSELAGRVRQALGSMGTAEVDGRAYQVTSMRIENGEIVITAVRHGLAPEVRDEAITITGPDGMQLCHGGSVSIPPVPPSHCAELDLRLSVDLVDP